jgi:hypothetical protein
VNWFTNHRSINSQNTSGDHIILECTAAGEEVTTEMKAMAVSTANYIKSACGIK